MDELYVLSTLADSKSAQPNLTKSGAPYSKQNQVNPFQ